MGGVQAALRAGGGAGCGSRLRGDRMPRGHLRRPRRRCHRQGECAAAPSWAPHLVHCLTDEQSILLYEVAQPGQESFVSLTAAERSQSEVILAFQFARMTAVCAFATWQRPACGWREVTCAEDLRCFPQVLLHYEAFRAAKARVTYKEFDFGHLDFTFAVTAPTQPSDSPKHVLTIFADHIQILSGEYPHSTVAWYHQMSNTSSCHHHLGHKAENVQHW